MVKKRNKKLGLDDRLVVKTDGTFYSINLKDITYAEVEGNYSTIFTKDSQYKIRTTLGDLTEKMDEKNFCRIHRSYLVNLNEVYSVQNEGHGDATTILRDDTELPVGRRQKEKMLRMLGVRLE